MDARAVVALVVVLGDRLPVRVDHVVVRRRDEHPVDLPRRDQLVEVADVLVQRRRVTGRVHEHPAVPLGDARGDQRVLALVEAGHVAEPGRAVQRPVQAVDPRVVRALDRAEVDAACRARAARALGAGRCWRTRSAGRASSRTSSTPSSPTRTARWSPGCARSSARPTHTHPAPKKCSASHARTSVREVRLRPAASGWRRASARAPVAGAPGSIGERVSDMAAKPPLGDLPCGRAMFERPFKPWRESSIRSPAGLENARRPPVSTDRAGAARRRRRTRPRRTSARPAPSGISIAGISKRF